MRVLVVSFMPGSGGVGIHSQDYTAELSSHGIAVGWLFHGYYDWKVIPYLKTYTSNQNVQMYDFRNSPNHHPGIAQPPPLNEVSQPAIEKNFIKVLEHFNPDIVHFMDFAGYCASLLRICYEHKIPTVNMHHSYWFICPKCTLIHSQTGQICSGPKGGQNCSTCVAHDPVRHNLESLRFTLGSSVHWITKRAVPVKKFVRKLNALTTLSAVTPMSDSDAATPKEGSSLQGRIHLWRQREEANLEACARYATLNLAGSTFVKQRFIDWGVPIDKIQVQHMGTRAAQFLKKTDKPVGDPLRIGYLGAVVPVKGVHVLTEAFGLLSDADREKIEIHIHGTGLVTYINRLKSKLSSGRVIFHGSYDYNDLPSILASFDITVVPPIWFDNSPQTVFESLSAGVPVIGARIGGIPDFVLDGENGYLFEAGNAAELAEYLKVVISSPDVIYELRNRIRPLKTIREQTIESIDLYRKLIERVI